MCLVSPRWFLLASLVIFPPLFIPSAFAQEDEASAQIQRLADPSADVRRDAIESLARSRDERVAKLLQAFQQGNLFVWKERVVLREDLKADVSGKREARLSDPLSRQLLLDREGNPVVVDAQEPRELTPTRQERRLVSMVLRFLQDFGAPDPDKRLAAVRRFGDSRNAEFLQPLEQVAASDPDKRVRRAARESMLLIRVSVDVAGETAEDRLAAVSALGEVHSRRGHQLLRELVDQGAVAPEESAVYEAAIRTIERYQFWVGLGRDLTNGLSLGSVLILMALGLSIIYGQMGVINMAHGELIMIGAYTTYEVQRAFGHTPDQPMNAYYIAAFPAAFCTAAAAGWLIERLVVRHLYGRVLETLLATWGVGLILIQLARVRYGDNIGINSPSWLVGSFELGTDFTISYNRGFILLLCGLCVLSLHWLMNYTRVGLKVRATVQSRETAESLGVCTRRIDGFTFSLGAGLAGGAGYALTLIAGVTPDMGQNYVVDSFLVVVIGGVGKLAGAVWAGLGIGTLNKVLEPVTFGAALLATGLIVALSCWIHLTIQAFRQDRIWGWLTLLVPVPFSFAIRFWSRTHVAKAFLLYLLGAAAAIIGLFPEVVPSDILSQDIRTIWAKVLILFAVVVFLQWRPAGLFPPKGRLADV